MCFQERFRNSVRFESDLEGGESSAQTAIRIDRSLYPDLGPLERRPVCHRKGIGVGTTDDEENSRPQDGFGRI